jgi:protein TonB
MNAISLPFAPPRPAGALAGQAFARGRRSRLGAVAGLALGHLALVAALLATRAPLERPREPAPLVLSVIPPAAPRTAPTPLPAPAAHPPAPQRLALPYIPDDAAAIHVAAAPPSPTAAPPAPAVDLLADEPPAARPAPAAPNVLPPSAVQYLVPPAPAYSRASARQKEHGRAVVRVWIDESGLPQQVALDRSSGFARLDEAALAAVRAARFRQCTENGRPLAGWAFVPIDFELSA